LQKIQVQSLDATDRAILQELARDGRLTNTELASRVGLAPSTCLARVKALVDKRVISGFSAQIEPQAIGLELQALISVTLRAGARANLTSFMQQIRELPQVIQVFFLGGTEDFIIHVAVKDSQEVREFVLRELSDNPNVANTRTNLIFEHFHKGPLG
jgi:DNA-binding Lrp family transcriptional regulator